MTNDKDLLREKMNDCYSEIFEPELIEEINITEGSHELNN